MLCLDFHSQWLDWSQRPRRGITFLWSMETVQKWNDNIAHSISASNLDFMFEKSEIFTRTFSGWDDQPDVGRPWDWPQPSPRAEGRQEKNCRQNLIRFNLLFLNIEIMIEYQCTTHWKIPKSLGSPPTQTGAGTVQLAQRLEWIGRHQNFGWYYSIRVTRKTRKICL